MSVNNFHLLHILTNVVHTKKPNKKNKNPTLCSFVFFYSQHGKRFDGAVCALLSGNRMTDSNWIRWICIAMLVSHTFIFQLLIKRQWVYHFSSELSLLLRKRQRNRWRRKNVRLFTIGIFYNEHIVEIDKFDCWSDYGVHYHPRSQHKRMPQTRFTPCVDLFACWDNFGTAIGWQRCRDREPCYRCFHCIAFNMLLICYFRVVRQGKMSSSMPSYAWLNLCKWVANDLRRKWLLFFRSTEDYLFLYKTSLA